VEHSVAREALITRLNEELARIKSIAVAIGCVQKAIAPIA
jgi:hypothetical protein